MLLISIFTTINVHVIQYQITIDIITCMPKTIQMDSPPDHTFLQILKAGMKTMQCINDIIYVKSSKMIRIKIRFLALIDYKNVIFNLILKYIHFKRSQNFQLILQYYK